MLKFINHACFSIETEASILIIDPWLEGSAFNNSWSLLDKSTSNKKMTNELLKTKKKIFIWISHEHSDHFSVPFAKCLKDLDIDVQYIFQNTADKRIYTFLNSLNLNCKESNDGVIQRIDNNLDIWTWAYESGDAYCLIRHKDNFILNLNDCYVSDKKQVKVIHNSIKNITSEINILFVQFGYAELIGNLNDVLMRKNAAIEKINRIKLQIEMLKPKIVIPFASFIYFSHEENFYLNDEQNTPKIILKSNILEKFRNKLLFLKPMDILNLEKDYVNQLNFKKINQSSLSHWTTLFNNIKPIFFTNKNNVKCENLVINFKIIKNQLNQNFIFLPLFLELIGFIKPLKIYLKHSKKILQISYIKDVKFLNAFENDYDIKMTEEVTNFIFKNDFGFNTTMVSGRFELNHQKSRENLLKFFNLMDANKIENAYKNPLQTIKLLYKKMIKFYYRK